MKITLIKGLTEAQVKEFNSDFVAAVSIRERFKTILQDKIDVQRSKGREDEAYTSSAWPYRQASINGYEKAMLEVISLLES